MPDMVDRHRLLLPRPLPHTPEHLSSDRVMTYLSPFKGCVEVSVEVFYDAGRRDGVVRPAAAMPAAPGASATF